MTDSKRSGGWGGTSTSSGMPVHVPGAGARQAAPLVSLAKASADHAPTPPLRRLGRLTGAPPGAPLRPVRPSLQGAPPLPSPLAAAGRTPDHDARLTALGGGLALARVSAVHRGGLELVTDAGPLAGFPTGRLRHAAASAADLPAVGDWVAHDPESGAVHAVLPRGSALVRAARDGREAQVLAANVDLVVIVAS